LAAIRSDAQENSPENCPTPAHVDGKSSETKKRKAKKKKKKLRRLFPKDVWMSHWVASDGKVYMGITKMPLKDFKSGLQQ
jgi:hypothetical protein